MTIGLDGMLDSPDTKSLFKSGKAKVHPKLEKEDFNDYGTNDKLVKEKTNEKPKLDNDYDNGVKSTIVPDSGKFETRSKFNLQEGDESKTGIHSQESVFDNKKKSTSGESDVFKGKFKNKKFSYGDD